MHAISILVPALVLVASGCGFGDNRPLEAGGCDPAGDCADGGGTGMDAAGADAGGADGAAADLDGAVAEACTLVAPQSGCPAGKACDLDRSALDSAATECRPIAADGDERSRCDDEVDCAAGYTCVDDPAGEASCMRYCAGEPDCAGPGSTCSVELDDGAGDPVPGVTLCTQSCNPVTANGCPPTWGCQPSRTFTRCRPSGPGEHLDACTGDDDCAVGFSCVDTGTLGTVCLRSCRVGLLGPCAAISGTSCVGYADPIVIGGIEYGACF